MNGRVSTTRLRFYLLQPRCRRVIKQPTGSRKNRTQSHKLCWVRKSDRIIRTARLELKRKCRSRTHLLIERNGNCITNDWICHAR